MEQRMEGMAPLCEFNAGAGECALVQPRARCRLLGHGNRIHVVQRVAVGAWLDARDHVQALKAVGVCEKPGGALG